MITKLFTSNELAPEIENITLCFIRDDIGEYINITVKDLINNWDNEKWENFTNYDPCMGDILVDDPDLNEVIIASNYCPCWGGLFSDLDMINEYLLNDGDLELLGAVYQCCSNIEETIQTINSGDYCVYSDCNDDYDLGYYIIEEFYSDLTQKCGFISNYIDYKAVGRDHRLESNGAFSELGWVEVY